MKEYISNFTPLIKDFISFKNALGIKYETGSYYLQQLDLYNYLHKNVTVPDRDTVDGWALKYAQKSITGDRSWISPIREFGRYLMTEVEIQCFFKECDQYVLQHKSPGRSYVLSALYRFLYCCGVRCCEARRLKCADVHLKEGFVDIFQAMAHRDRRLFLSDEFIEHLKKYDKAVSKCFPNGNTFFREDMEEYVPLQLFLRISEIYGYQQDLSVMAKLSPAHMISGIILRAPT